jgi:hypothetical protein
MLRKGDPAPTNSKAAGRPFSCLWTGTKDRALLVISLEVANIISNFHHPQGNQIDPLVRRIQGFETIAHNEIRMIVLVNKQLGPLVPGLNDTWLQLGIHWHHLALR